ncbi:TadE family protein [Shewanella algae]|uniref:TadE family protein n=1 Tax=Shewanella algae TaxID=38313 RepID=UPI00214C95B7|nr:TadE family protein [Shewanella algae]
MKRLTSQTGQAMMEFNLALPFLMPLVLVAMMLLVQWGFIYSAKSTLDAATVKAVRSGALNHGSLSAIRKGLSEGMMPLYNQDPSLTGTLGALAKARIAVTTQAKITILSPDKKVFDRFKVRSTYQGKSLYEIPNNNLMYRNPALQNLGNNRQLNIQDANLLQIEVRWCQKLIVPFANYVLREIVSSPLYMPSKQQLECNLLSRATGDIYLAMVSDGLMRMQTPFRM